MDVYVEQALAFEHARSMGLHLIAIAIDWKKLFDRIVRKIAFALMRASLPEDDPEQRYIDAEERILGQYIYRYKVGTHMSKEVYSHISGFLQGSHVSIQVALRLLAVWSAAIEAMQADQMASSMAVLAAPESLRTLVMWWMT